MPAPIHEHPEEWLAASLVGDLTSEESRALAAHVEQCERCRALQAEFMHLDETLRRELPAAAGPTAGFETRLVAGFRHRHEAEGAGGRLGALLAWFAQHRGMQLAGLAVVLLALVGVGQLLTVGGASFGVHAVSLRGGPVAGAKRGPAALSGAADFQRDSKAPASSAQRVAQAQTSKDAGRDGTPVLGDVRMPVLDGARLGQAESDTPAGHAFALKRSMALDATSSKVDAGDANDQGADVSFNTRPAPREVPAEKAKAAAPATLNRTGSYGLLSAASASVDKQLAPTVPAAPAAAPAAVNSIASPPADQESGGATPAAPDPRKLIRNAQAELEVVNFDAAVDAITAAATADGGFLDTRNSARGGNGKVTGTLVVKVLPENLDKFLLGLRALGEVRDQTLRTDDVTKDYYDTDARLRNARRMEDRLLKMLDEVKGKMSEVLQVEKELGRVRADIEQMQGQLKLYDSQVRYATVTLTVYEKDLQQPAAFLLRETATLALLAADVEKTASEVRRIADAAHAQVVRSDLTRDPAGRSRATLSLLIAPEAAPALIADVKAQGRVANFNLQDERIAQHGGSASVPGAAGAQVERAPVNLDLTISHDEQISRQVSFTLVAADVAGAFEKARAAAVAAGGEVVTSNVAQTPDGHAHATLGVRVPAAAEAALVGVLKTLGRAGEMEVQRVVPGTGPETGPVQISVDVVDVEPAVQETTVRVQTSEVERRANEIKQAAAANHVEVEQSNFSSETDGRQQAALQFRLPLSAYADFIARVRALGTVQDFTVQREDRPSRTHAAGEPGAPATIDLTLYSEGRIVADDSGLGSTLRRTFRQGIGALMWSVQMIGVALAFLAPWALLVAAIVALWWWLRRRANRPRNGPPRE